MKHERPQPEARGAVEPRQGNSTPPPPAHQEPEAAELPEGITTLAQVLTELPAILTGLRQALESLQAEPLPEPVAYRKADAARMCGMAVRTLEYLASAGKFAKPDAYAGRCPLWTRETLARWIREGGGRI
jgi:hypothetical protein